jgi:hypothetical protein
MASRTKELRRAAAVMNQPAPMLSQEEIDWLENQPALLQRYLDNTVTHPLPYDCGHRRPRGVPLVGPYHVCPGCENQDRRNRRHWFLLAVAVALALAVTCSARAASDGPCAPYSPIDGRTCAPPARLGHVGQAPVCYCPGPKVARR